MVDKNIYSKETGGFTIIEVLIVLAVAGLILLIVFLAVPQLNRVERNRQRKADAGQIASLTRECLVRSQMNVTRCDTSVEVGIDTTKLRFVTDVIYCGSGGVTTDTRCTDTYSHPSGQYPVILALSSYNNNTMWGSSAVIPVVMVNYGKQCRQNIVNPIQNTSGKSDFIMTITLETPNFPQTQCYAT